MRATSLSIAQKLPVMIAGLAASAAIIVGGAAYWKSSKTLNETSRAMLAATSVEKGENVQALLVDMEKQVKQLAASKEVGAALDQFSGAFNELGPDAQNLLQAHYIDQNPNAVGQKEKLDTANTGTTYDTAHGQLHPWFRTILQLNDYYDIFLFDAAGRNVYTVYKERDFATQLANGQWKDSNLGELVRKVLNGPTDAGPSFVDFAPYAPSNGVPAGFIGVPILGSDGKIKGALAIQVSINKFDHAMSQVPANGTTGENALVGADGLMRNNSPLSKEGTILKRKIDNEAVNLARQGQKGVVTGVNAAGAPSTIAYSPVSVMGTNYAVISDITKAEVNRPLRDLALNVALITLAILGLTAGVGIWFARGIIRPIGGLTEAMRTLAGGDTSSEVPFTNRNDEVGTMAQAVQVFRENALERARLEGLAQEDLIVQTQRAQVITSATQAYEQAAGDMLRAVSAASAELEATALAMTSAAERTNHMAVSVAAAAEESTVSASTAAGSAESLTSSISLIQTNVAQSSAVADEAVRLSGEAQTAVGELASSAERIGEVVELIKGIADQTNLLALNATIEAARAGEAGKGFAIVAQEVKNLASQTGNATGDIAAQISSIRGAVEGAVGAMSRIEAVIQRINDNAASIGVSVETQATVTGDIAMAINQVAASSQSVASDVSLVTETAGETGAAAGEVLAASRELSLQAAKLDQETQDFLARVRAA
jgi:methyl-accepting chemotaxis protein